MKKLIVCLLALVLVGCVNTSPETAEPVPTTTPVATPPVLRQVAAPKGAYKFVDKTTGVVCYVIDSPHLYGGRNISCVQVY